MSVTLQRQNQGPTPQQCLAKADQMWTVSLYLHWSNNNTHNTQYTICEMQYLLTVLITDMQCKLQNA